MMATRVLMAARTIFPSVPLVVLRILNPLTVYNAIHKVQDELYSTPEDRADFLAKLEAEPGMFVRRTFDNLGRIVDVFWATVDQQDKMSRFGGCLQMDTTVFTNRYVGDDRA